MATESKKNLSLTARSQAVDALIAENEDRFHELRAEKSEALGITYERPETPEMKAKREFDALVKEYPSLLDNPAGDGQTGEVAPDGSTVVAPGTVS